MDRPLYGFFGAFLGFLAAFIPYVSDRRLPRKWRKTVPQEWGNVVQGNWWPIAWWVTLAGVITVYAGYGYHLDKVEQREQRDKDAAHQRESLELKSQIRTLTASERRDRLIAEAETRRFTTGEVRRPPVDELEPGMVIDLSGRIAAPPAMVITLRLYPPTSLAARYALELDLTTLSDKATPTSFRITCNTEIYDAFFYVGQKPHLRNRKTGFSIDKKTYLFSYHGPPFINGSSPIVVIIGATSPLKIERVEQKGFVSTIPNLGK